MISKMKATLATAVLVFSAASIRLRVRDSGAGTARARSRSDRPACSHAGAGSNRAESNSQYALSGGSAVAPQDCAVPCKSYTGASHADPRAGSDCGSHGCARTNVHA